MPDVDADRYSRQTRFASLGPDGQAKLLAARIAVVGCGALGSVVAMTLARAGVGFLRLIDRDVPEISNLPRQVLFDEADVAAGLPKAVAAARQLGRINSQVSIEPIVADLMAMNVAELLGGIDVIVDGTDNFEARFLVNEFACRHGVPWVHGGAIGAEGRVMTVVPGRTACLRCLIPEPPAPGSLATCDTAGIIGPAALVVGAVEAAEAMKLVVGSGDKAGDYPWLEGRLGARPTPLCGRDAVQVPSAGGAVDLAAIAARLAAVGSVVANRWIVRAEVEEGIQLSVFADGRAIVSGTREEAKARAIVSRYLGA